MHFMTREEIERAEMEQQALQHEVRNLPFSLDKEQLRALEVLMNTITGQEDGRAIASFYAGIIGTIMHTKFGRCTCGQDHEQVEDLLKEEIAESKSSHPAVGPDGWVNHAFDTFSGNSCTVMVTYPGHDGVPYGDQCGLPSNVHRMSKSTVPGEPDEAIVQSNDREKLCDEYNVSFNPDGHTVKCRGCNMNYQSLRDRILKGPDDCHGCHLKSKGN